MSSRGYQFSILRLLMAMTSVAVVLAMARNVSITPLGQVIVGVYFGFIAGWIVLRWPVIYVSLMEVRRRRHAILKQRKTMEQEIAQRRRQTESAGD
jgi:hypothetical protein